ncbi:MAG: dienelactone hydrolase family protein [Gemmatimonadetes bacterium]|nr:dienelactone hydrolase family protein [Gemmatimonadota bacterium]
MRPIRFVIAVLGVAVVATVAARASERAAVAGDTHVHDAGPGTEPAAAIAAEQTAGDAQQAGLPAGAAQATQRVQSSPRHGEWVTIRTGADSVRAWVVYPERSERAPVVLVVHEIFGLSNWIRGVADQVAADGFIAIAPDLLTMQDVPERPDGESDPDAARVAIRTLQPADVHRQLRAVADWGMKLPAAKPVYGIVGYCWGGSTSFAHAVASADLGAAVVYYGSSPDAAALATVRAPVLGLYGEDDARVNATIAPADEAMKRLGRTYEHHIFAGAGHGFLRAQEDRNGANLEATRRAWPLTIQWFRTHLEG